MWVQFLIEVNNEATEGGLSFQQTIALLGEAAAETMADVLGAQHAHVTVRDDIRRDALDHLLHATFGAHAAPERVVGRRERFDHLGRDPASNVQTAVAERPQRQIPRLTRRFVSKRRQAAVGNQTSAPYAESHRSNASLQITSEPSVAWRVMICEQTDGSAADQGRRQKTGEPRPDRHPGPVRFRQQS